MAIGITHAQLHYHVLSHIVEHGYAPKISSMTKTFAASEAEVITALKALQEYHGVVLHPHSSEVWVMHPFATAPTNFFIQAGSDSWWGNCAWCSLGAAALLDRDLVITTTLGAEAKQVGIEIINGEIQNKNLYVHFPIPMMQAWDNVTYTCSTMLLFESDVEIDDWCMRHDINKGDVQPIDTIWQFSKVWYGNHLNPEWQKWDLEQAKDIFSQFGLTHSVWNLPDGKERF